MEYTQLDSDVRRLTESLGQLPEPMVEPAFVVVSGLPGTGRAYFCNRLAERLPYVILESDALRKALFPSPSYSSQESSHLFWVIHNALEVKLILVRVEAPPQVVYKRLKTRQENPESKSDADWKVYQEMKPTVQKIRRNHYAVDTPRDITPVLNKIVREVNK